MADPSLDLLPINWAPGYMAASGWIDGTDGGTYNMIEGIGLGEVIRIDYAAVSCHLDFGGTCVKGGIWASIGDTELGTPVLENSLLVQSAEEAAFIGTWASTQYTQQPFYIRGGVTSLFFQGGGGGPLGGISYSGGIVFYSIGQLT